MDKNFHYYVTYTAAIEAGYGASEAKKIARACLFVDEDEGVTSQKLKTIVQENCQIPGNRKDKDAIKAIAKIWPVFHFLPGDSASLEPVRHELLAAGEPMLRYGLRMICKPNSTLGDTLVIKAKEDMQNRPNTDDALARAGITMHVLADTFAHQNFVGLPLRQINEVETVHIKNTGGGLEKVKWGFVLLGGDTETYAPAGPSKSSFGYLGHGRMGHIPDRPGAIYGYAPAWHGDIALADGSTRGSAFLRVNPEDYYSAWLQMVKALRFFLDPNAAPDTYPDVPDNATAYAGMHDLLCDVFLDAYTDDALPDKWLKELSVDDPGAYEQPAGNFLTSFKTQAERHRDVVMENCQPLAEMIGWLNG